MIPSQQVGRIKVRKLVDSNAIAWTRTLLPVNIAYGFVSPQGLLAWIYLEI